MKPSVRLFARLRRAATILQDLFDDTATDPLAEHPLRILTTSEHETIRRRRDDLGEDQRDVRIDLGILLRAVERLGDRVEAAHELLSDALQASAVDHYAVIFQASSLLSGDDRYKPRPRANLMTWLMSPWEGDLPFREGANPLVALVSKPTVLQVIAALVGMNGGTQVMGTDVFEDGGPFGRMGLSREEADELIYLDGMLQGWIRSGAADVAHVVRLINTEVKALSAQRILAMHPPTTKFELHVNGEKVADVTDVEITES